MIAAPSCGGNFFVDPQLTLITVNPPSPSMLIFTSLQFTATGTYDDGTKKLLGPTVVVWSSSNQDVLAVDSSTGMATATSTSGSATVTASAQTVSGSTTVTVAASTLTSIDVTPKTPSISFASQTTQQFKATGTYANGNRADITASVTWSSSDSTVATIDTLGLATAKNPGDTAKTATITATAGSVSGSTILTVNH
jgi:hypothetical protein